MVSGLGLQGEEEGYRGDGCSVKSPTAWETRVMVDKDKQGPPIAESGSPSLRKSGGSKQSRRDYFGSAAGDPGAQGVCEARAWQRRR